MKEGWKEYTLGDCCEIYQPQTIASGKLVPNGKYLVYGANGVIGRYSDFNHQDSEVLLCCRGATCGAVNVSKPYSWINGNAMVVKPNPNILQKKFLRYLLFSLDYTHIITGAAQPQITRKSLSPVKIFCPPLSEQQRIVSRLDASFAKIDALSKQAEEALEQGKALFQAKLKELMEKKEGWEEKKLGEICSIESKLVDPTKAEFVDLLHVGGANIVSFTGELVGLKTAKEEKITSGKFYFDDKVVLYNKIRPYLVKVTRPDFDGLCSADMYPLTPSKIVTKDYLYYILITKDFTEYAVKRSARAGMPKVNRECLFAYECYIPSLSEQHQIVQTLDSLSLKIQQLEENTKQVIVNCDALKQSLLRQVFEV